MTNTTNTKDLTEQKENRKAILSLEDLDARDYFAAKAMQGFASNLGPGVTFNSRAEIAYEWADAMLKAREQ